MKRLHLATALTVLVMLMGCSTDSLPQNQEGIQENKEFRTLDEALFTLDSFISDNYPATKASGWPKIKSISNYYGSDPATKSIILPLFNTGA